MVVKESQLPCVVGDYVGVGSVRHRRVFVTDVDPLGRVAVFGAIRGRFAVVLDRSDCERDVGAQPEPAIGITDRNVAVDTVLDLVALGDDRDRFRDREHAFLTHDDAAVKAGDPLDGKS